MRPRILLSLVVLLGGISPIHAHEVDPIKYSSSPLLKDSKWGFIAAVQRALNRELKSCPDEYRTTIGVDGVFGQSTSSMLDLLGRCKNKVGSINGGSINHAAVSELFPRDKIPTALDRASMLTFTMQGRDFDCMQWNVAECPRKGAGYYRRTARVSQCPDHKASGYSFSWGPFGASATQPGSAAHSLSRKPGEATEILRALSRKDSDRLYEVFDEANATGLRSILQYRPSGTYATGEPLESMYKSICQDESQRNAWKRAFKNLGKEQFVREAYDEHAFGRGWLLTGLRRRYDIYDDVGLKPSEVDFGFILDRTIHRGTAVNNGGGGCRIQDRYWDLYDLLSGVVSDNALMRYAFLMCAQDPDPTLDRGARDLVYLRHAFGPTSTLIRKATDTGRARAFLEDYRLAVSPYRSSFGTLTAESVGLSDEQAGPKKGQLSKLKRTQW